MNVSELSYEQARDELISVVAELERGASSLEQSLQLWERGEALAARCEEWLIGARARLDAARAGAAASSTDAARAGAAANNTDAARAGAVGAASADPDSPAADG